MASYVRDTDKGFKAMLKRITNASAGLTVGVHEADGSKPHEPKPKSDASGVEIKAKEPLTIIQIAAFHEFGTSRMDRRSFIADWADEDEQEHKRQLSQMARAVYQGTVASAEQALYRLGNLYVGEVQRRISQGITPPLKQSTIDRKGSSKPLEDTGQLRSSIRFVVKK